MVMSNQCTLLHVQVQQELGLQIHPWQESIIDMVTTLIQRGIAKPVLAQ